MQFSRNKVKKINYDIKSIFTAFGLKFRWTKSDPADKVRKEMMKSLEVCSQMSAFSCQQAEVS
jgi:hypothetical protein